MSRNLFDDIFLARGLKGLLAPPDMDNAVPKPGSILGGFDYRKPFENAGLENVLAATDTSFAPMSPPMSVNVATPAEGIQRGTKISPGDIIGYSDGSGTKEPHLHMEVQRGSREFPATYQTPRSNPELILQRHLYRLKNPWPKP